MYAIIYFPNYLKKMSTEKKCNIFKENEPRSTFTSVRVTLYRPKPNATKARPISSESLLSDKLSAQEDLGNYTHKKIIFSLFPLCHFSCSFPPSLLPLCVFNWKFSLSLFSKVDPIYLLPRDNNTYLTPLQAEA